MPEAWLECRHCGSQHPVGPIFSGCAACLDAQQIHPLEVAYRRLPAALSFSSHSGIWRWRDWLPPINDQSCVSLGEAFTPLVPLEIEGILPRLLLKNETMNPTWSWKDRPNAISISMAKEFGFPGVIAISTGNHGTAAAAYAARAGIDSLILCHKDAPALQVALMESYGAKVIRGGEQEALARESIAAGGIFPATILCPGAGFSNPYGIEGFKTIAFEITRDLGGTPDCVFVPVGSGDGIYGIWKGFRELLQAGIIDQAPRMIACQSAGADSAVRAFDTGSYHVEPVSPSTIALSIAEPLVGGHAMRAIYESKGQAIAVTDSEIVAASLQASERGFCIEAASAAALAGAVQFARRLENKGTWVVIGSGAGVKWPDQLMQIQGRANENKLD